MKLFQYEHCPYCVRVRLAAAIKNIDLDIVDLTYDDEKTPISMIGAKKVPILQKADQTFMPESLDICDYLDHLDNNPQIKAKNIDQDFDQLMHELNGYISYLAYPRAYRHPMNKDVFPTKAAIDYFKLPKEEKMGISFDQALIESNKYLNETNTLLGKIAPFLDRRLKKGSLANGGFSLSYDDIEYFPLLRSLTLASDVIELPDLIKKYLEKISSLSKVKLYTPFNYGI